MNLRGMPSSHTTEEAVNLTPLDQYIANYRMGPFNYFLGLPINFSLIIIEK